MHIKVAGNRVELFENNRNIIDTNYINGREAE